MPSAYAIFHRGKAITPSDGVNQPHQWARIYCLTAGNFVFTLLDSDTAVEGADITLAMVAGQALDVTPVKVKTTSTGTYLGLNGS